MSADEENAQGPKWLRELEEKRERRLRVRLGHEAGAGSKCLDCEDRCPGLDLHFWRKICKNCKCGKESHDIGYDDDYGGWAQFQLLGSKPNKANKFVLSGNKESVDLEWVPKGQNDAVQEYLREVGLKSLPVKGTPAALRRKQLLHQQIPLHDIDPSFCHSLDAIEECKLNDYVRQVKSNSVGVGHIAKLNDLIRKRLELQQLDDPKLPHKIMERVQIPSTVNANHLVHYDFKNVANDVESIQKALENVRLPLQTGDNSVEERQPVTIGVTRRDITYPAYGQTEMSNNLKSSMPNYANKIPVVGSEMTQSAAQFGKVRDVYPDMNVNNLRRQEYGPANIKNALETSKEPIKSVHDLAYSTYDPDLSNCNINNPQAVVGLLPQANPNDNCGPYEQQYDPQYVHVGPIRDIEYESNLPPDSSKSFPFTVPENKQISITSSASSFPKCEHCGLCFDENSVVVGIERTGALWHVNCFRCARCDQQLADLLYFYDEKRGRIFCGRDYAREQGIPRCKACDELIFSKEYCLAEDNTFHVRHFCCYECDEPLAGKSYVLEDEQPHCLTCFDSIKANRCHVCKGVIKPHQKGVQLAGVHIHADDLCFVCSVCSHSLFNTKLLFKNYQLYCSSDCFQKQK